MKIICQLHTWEFHRSIDHKKNESISITIHGKTAVGIRQISFEIIVEERKDLGEVSGYICKPFGFDDGVENAILPIIVNLNNAKIMEFYEDLTKAKTVSADRVIAIFTGRRPTEQKNIIWEWDMTNEIEIESWGYTIGFTE
jgi:hypothetical protein